MQTLHIPGSIPRSEDRLLVGKLRRNRSLVRLGVRVPEVSPERLIARLIEDIKPPHLDPPLRNQVTLIHDDYSLADKRRVAVQ